MKKFLLVLCILSICSSVFAYDNLYANDGTFLGTNNPNTFDPQSIYNPYGKYGSQFSSYSINNPYGTYGSQYSSKSPNNPFAQNGYAVPVNGGFQRNFGSNPTSNLLMPPSSNDLLIQNDFSRYPDYDMPARRKNNIDDYMPAGFKNNHEAVNHTVDSLHMPAKRKNNFDDYMPAGFKNNHGAVNHSNDSLHMPARRKNNIDDYMPAGFKNNHGAVNHTNDSLHMPANGRNNFDDYMPAGFKKRKNFNYGMRTYPQNP